MNNQKTSALRILAVDDEKPILDLYPQILATSQDAADGLSSLISSLDLVLCEQAREAVEAVWQSVEQKRPFAVAFIDINLPPGPDGVWAAEQIRKLDSNINIVLVTGYADPDLKELKHRIPPPDKLLYLGKPFRLQEIWQLVSSQCAKWQAEQDLLAIRANLESLVDVRASELLEANRKLEIEIEDRIRGEESLRSIIGGIVHAMAMIVEGRDPYTAGHQRRVNDLACSIAAEMGISNQEIEGIHVAGLIHDIGKISVPAEILSKPGKLSENEFGLIKEHPRVAYDILKTIDFPWPVAEIVLQHHEKLDGSGYPRGLYKKDIIREARILTVADVVEAMASHRPYRPALGIDKALEEISRNKGILYDSEVVDACVKLFAEKKFRFE